MARLSANTARCTCRAIPSSIRNVRSSTWRSAISSQATSAFGLRTMGGIVGMCICNDRRWPETYRVMGLQGVELIVLGYNTPSVNSQNSGEGPEKRLFHNRLTLQAGAYQNSTWVVAVAKGGAEDGFHMIAGSVIVNPDGEIVVEAKTEDDELIVADCDLDATVFGKETIFDFRRHRRIEHYGRITSQTGVILPPEL